jgi:hypothetical protein
MKTRIIVAVAMTLLIGGCAANSARTRTTTAPAGPIQAATTDRNTVPAGTSLAIRVNEDISTKEAGRTFDAQIAQDVVNQSGAVLIPRGSRAELVVTQVSDGGVAGTRTMELSLRSVVVNGQRRQVSTLSQEQRGDEGLGGNRRTAETVGGGAALGALLGAVLGGGKGAAIGAAVGAAGGATAQVLTRGDEVRVPAETVLTFLLDQPMQLLS